MAVASAIAFLSISLLAADALLDLNANALVKRLESAQASFVDTMAQHRLAFMATLRSSSTSAARADGTDSLRKQEITCRSATAQAFGPSLKKMVGARGFEPPTPSLPD